MKARRGRSERQTKRSARPAYLDDDRALAADLYAHRNDPEAASERATKIESGPTGMQVVSFRLPTEELRLVLRVANTSGESLSGFVRGALALRMGRELIVSPIEWTFGTPGTSRGTLALNSLTGAILGRSQYVRSHHTFPITVFQSAPAH